MSYFNYACEKNSITHIFLVTKLVKFKKKYPKLVQIEIKKILVFIILFLIVYLP